MNKFIFAGLMAFSGLAFAQVELSAALVGIVNTNQAVRDKNTGILYPDDIWFEYKANDPKEGAVVLAWISFNKTGTHSPTIEYINAEEKKVNVCSYGSIKVSKLPDVESLTCEWGGRQPPGGLTFTVYDKIDGVKEEIGSITLPQIPSKK